MHDFTSRCVYCVVQPHESGSILLDTASELYRLWITVYPHTGSSHLTVLGLTLGLWTLQAVIPAVKRALQGQCLWYSDSQPIIILSGTLPW
jgi:hypothetical protein